VKAIQKLILLLEVLETVINSVIDDMPNYRNNLSIIEAKTILSQLKADYDSKAGNRERQRLG